MIKTSPELCSTCKYSWTTSTENYIVCQYILIKHERRGCKLGECDKYEKGKRIRLSPL